MSLRCRESSLSEPLLEDDLDGSFAMSNRDEDIERDLITGQAAVRKSSLLRNRVEVSRVYYYKKSNIFERCLILLLVGGLLFVSNTKFDADFLKSGINVDFLKSGVSDLTKPKPTTDSDKGDSFATISVGASRDPKVGVSAGYKPELTTHLPTHASDSESSNLNKNSNLAYRGGNGVKELKEVKVAQPGEEATSLWKNKYDICHVMTTRFMQLQPGLLTLGKARLDLFRTFTLPSLKAQTTDEFLWVIFTDPDLHQDLLDELVDMVKPYENFLVLGMNTHPNDFRTNGWFKNIKKVFSGNLQLLKDYHAASKTHVFLETRIDADDSIFVDMMETVQRQASQSLGIRAFNSTPAMSSGEYRVYCTESHLEWGYFNPWEKHSEKGHLFGVTHPIFCISAGLTYASQVGNKGGDFPTRSHYKMNQMIKPCNGVQTLNCLERIDAGDYKWIMLRSRTPTSAGMAGVIPTPEVISSQEWKQKQNETWHNVIQKNFNVTPESIWELRRRFKEKMKDILSDALAGQCTKAEFTCKSSTKEDLSMLLEQVKENS